MICIRIGSKHPGASRRRRLDIWSWESTVYWRGSAVSKMPTMDG